MKNVYLMALGMGLLASCGHMATPETAQAAQHKAKPTISTETAVNAQTLTAEFTPSASLEGQIVNGVISARGARPYQVALTTPSGFQFCGGTLIANNWVLTAAHCTVGKSASQIAIRAGANRLSSTQGEVIASAAIYNHPNYRSVGTGYDIALIRLSSPVTAAYTSVAKLPNDSVESVLDVAGKMAVVSGWGDTYSGANAGSDDLREVAIPITPNPTRCGYNGTPLPGNTICGNYYQGKDSCQGDSGGPLAQTYTGCSGDGMYTRVNGYLPWIAQVSGVTADGSTAQPTNPTPTTPGTVTYTGTLSSGQTVYAPNANGFYYAGGTLKGALSGPSGTDYDLALQKKGTTGLWVNVASSEGANSSESISYNAYSGTYRWAVYAYSGSGSVQLVETK